jgi:surface carbohydrate biosynthesis protein (TIGR04326 family)
MGEQMHISTFTYAFENQILEKMFCLGLEKSSPRTRKIAYTSTFAIPMYTFYSISKHEKGIIPLPDRIVVNSNRSREVLLDSGFSETEILVAGDIRYATKTAHMPENIIPPFKENAVIFVPLSAAILDSIELIHKIISAFKDDLGIQVIFKSHPVLPFRSLQGHLPVFPPHITFQDKTIGELLDTADLIIYTETTVSIEALARGIPVLHVTSDQRIDMNPLEGYSCIPSVSKPDELHSIAFMLLQTRTEQQEIYKKIASGFFNEIQPDLTEIFISKNLNRE